MNFGNLADHGLTFGLSYLGGQANAQLTIVAGVARELIEATLTGAFDFLGLLASFFGVLLALA